MPNIIFLFGSFAGLIIIGAMVAVIVASGGVPSDMSSRSVYFGYLVMIVGLSMIFFAVKRYRDQELGGVIKFMPAFLMGVGITVVASVIYVLVWEVYMAATNYTFMDAYAAAMVDEARRQGLTGADLEKIIKEMEEAKVLYANPLARMAMTFLEIFPVGLLIALISAAVLRNPKVLPARA